MSSRSEVQASLLPIANQSFNCFVFSLLQQNTKTSHLTDFGCALCALYKVKEVRPDHMEAWTD